MRYSSKILQNVENQFLNFILNIIFKLQKHVMLTIVLNDRNVKCPWCQMALCQLVQISPNQSLGIADYHKNSILKN